jgi:putative (di)nucleoside polyphosphate hydrolase
MAYLVPQRYFSTSLLPNSKPQSLRTKSTSTPINPGFQFNRLYSAESKPGKLQSQLQVSGLGKSDNDKHNRWPSKFRPSVGAIVFNQTGKLLCGRRKDLGYWQFPQGGMHPEEDPVNAALREVNEEMGLPSDKLEMVPQPLFPHERFCYHRSMFKDGIHYDGQEQRYVLFQWDGDIASCNLDPGFEPPEFSEVAWLNWDELISKCVPSRTFIYGRLRNTVKPLIADFLLSKRMKGKGVELMVLSSGDIVGMKQSRIPTPSYLTWAESTSSRNNNSFEFLNVIKNV